MIEPLRASAELPSSRPEQPPGPLARALIALIRLYQVTLSRLMGPVCRFYPSCSHYTAQCLELHGALRGSYLGVRRILRCHPFNPGGYDPPPPPMTHPTKRFEARKDWC